MATLTLAVVSYPLRMVRASMMEVMQSDYVLLAQLHGLSRRRVVFRHALPNAVATTIQATALNLVFLAGGVVVVESVFSYPGSATRSSRPSTSATSRSSRPRWCCSRPSM